MAPEVLVPARHARLIAELQALGLIARLRRGAMGDTILVAAATDRIEEGIERLIRSICLCPSGGDDWVIDVSPIGGRSESPPISDAAISDEVRKVVATDESYAAAKSRWRTR